MLILFAFFLNHKFDAKTIPRTFYTKNHLDIPWLVHSWVEDPLCNEKARERRNHKFWHRLHGIHKVPYETLPNENHVKVFTVLYFLWSILSDESKLQVFEMITEGVHIHENMALSHSVTFRQHTSQENRFKCIIVNWNWRGDSIPWNFRWHF